MCKNLFFGRGMLKTGPRYSRVILTGIYRSSGMKSFRDDLIDRMKTRWGRFVLASLSGCEYLGASVDGEGPGPGHHHGAHPAPAQEEGRQPPAEDQDALRHPEGLPRC